MKPGKDLSAPIRTRRDQKIAALLFSAAVALPYFHYLLPENWWLDTYWAVSYGRSVCFYASVALALPFTLPGFKVAFTALGVVSSATMGLQSLGVPASYQTAVSATLWLFIVYGAWRGYNTPKIGGAPEPGYDGAYILRVPIHSWVGVWQALLMPWHHARYETRVVIQRQKAWYIHRGKFRKMTKGAEFLLGWGDAEPLGRDLTPEETAMLNGLEGQRRIYGIRDCRRFEL